MTQPYTSHSLVRVRYAETDAQGVVYYANFLVWVEVGRVDYLRAAGLSYRDIEKHGWGIMIVEASCRYHAPARFDDELQIDTWCDEIKRSSFRLRYTVTRTEDELLLAEGHTTQVFLNLKEQRPAALPDELRAILERTAAPS